MDNFEDHTLDDAAAELREAALRGDNTRTIYTSVKNKPCPFISGCALTGYCRGCSALQGDQAGSSQSRLGGMVVETKSKEIHKGAGDKLFEFCPHCGSKLEHAWQQARNQDDSNPVRVCHKCDTAWIWHIY